MAVFQTITKQKDPALEIYASLNETQLLHYFEPKAGIFIAESPNVIERALEASYEPISALIQEKQIDEKTKNLIEKLGDITVYTASDEVFCNITGYKLTRGMLCAMQRKSLPGLEEICQGKKRIVVLENVVNPTNIGAIFRSAAALHMDGILLTPGCADPFYRRASRVSMGTVFQIPWSYGPSEMTDILHELGFKTVAMALCEDSVGIDDKTLNEEEKLAIFLGTEGDGLAKETIANCDYTVMIPMSHGVDSLNVAAASAVAFWELGRTNRQFS